MRPRYIARRPRALRYLAHSLAADLDNSRSSFTISVRLLRVWPASPVRVAYARINRGSSEREEKLAARRQVQRRAPADSTDDLHARSLAVRAID